MKSFILKKSTPAFIRYHQRAWKKHMSIVSQKKHDKTWNHIFTKAYPRFPHISLNTPVLPNIPLYDVLRRRSSQRNFSKHNLTFGKIESLLYFSCGINKRSHSVRFYPSAGARFPLEVYTVMLQGRYKNNLYHYYAPEHLLEKLGAVKQNTLIGIFGQDWKWIGKGGMIVLITAVFKRTVHKYGEKGYEFAFLEAGHMGQNIYLISEALKLHCCALGGYDAKMCDSLLEVDGIKETVIYSFVIG
ncbi:MAG: SagB/ThcOx family dehydrogenase [Patescibacteria group bacterium]